MINLTSDFTQNPILLNSLIKQHLVDQYKDTAGTLDIEKHIDTVWQAELFPNEIDKKPYGHRPYFERSASLEGQPKENEWLRLIGIDFYSLSEEKRNFLLKTAGIFDFGKEIDIKKVYRTSIY